MPNPSDAANRLYEICYPALIDLMQTGRNVDIPVPLQLLEEILTEIGRPLPDDDVAFHIGVTGDQ